MAEFRALWFAVVLSRGGTQLARVALAVLAYQRTGSPAVTALVYALTLLPAIIGGSFLGGLADRYPRRELLVVCALSRAGLVALIAIPGIPLWILCVLVFVVQMIESPAKAAQMALLPDMLTGEAYSTGLAAIVLTGQIVSLVAFAAGGVLVGAIGTSGTLFLNAVAFALMALIIRWGLPHSPAARLTEPGDRWWPRFRDPDGGARLILGSPRLRSLLALALLAGFYVVPEVLAAPYAAELGLGTAEVGLLMAVMPVGNVVGVFLITRFVPPDLRLRSMGPLAIASSVPLVFSALFPGFVPSLILWTLVGVLSAYQVTANAEFVRIAPRERRGQVLGLASSVLVAVQGAGMILGGVLADHVGVSLTLVLAGVAGSLMGVLAAVSWHRARQGAGSPEVSPSSSESLR
ncbi:MFS transporter [Streptosporangium lutulentum]|uniref:MFS family permease n=1 Tax=Streptosporangium lutulentum TaxID=1461250 RepID=A0ABT9QF57_9ACTN|nr:MFS transporter [Streptosporangium lutulentum]MDP9845395.1 MFS family permease [Streptosporangium lutulentum]